MGVNISFRGLERAIGAGGLASGTPGPQLVAKPTAESRTARVSFLSSAFFFCRLSSLCFAKKGGESLAIKVRFPMLSFFWRVLGASNLPPLTYVTMKKQVLAERYGHDRARLRSRSCSPTSPLLAAN